MKIYNISEITITLIVIIIWSFSVGNNIIVAQQWHPLQVDQSSIYPQSPGLYQLNSGYPSSQPFFRIGDYFPSIGTQTYPKFHISTDLSDIPEFQIDAIIERELDGSLQFFVTDPNLNPPISYGIYQSGIQYNNYFQGSIGTESKLYFYGPNTSIISNNEPFYFTMKFTSLGAQYTPMTIFRKKIQVIDTMECTNLMLHFNAGIGKVLMSDQYGNGIWRDPSMINDNDWLIENFESGEIAHENLYSNPRYENIGIGTEHPRSKLHVMDGNILISRSAKKAPGSINGSILFGGIISDEWPLGEWGIEYLFNEESYTGGLNFWKVESEVNAGANYCLFLKNDGLIGVGTDQPQANLDVIGSIRVSSLATTGSNQMIIADNQGILSTANIPAGDNLGNHVASQNINLNGHYLSGNGLNKGVFVNSNGEVGIGTNAPISQLDISFLQKSEVLVRSEVNSSMWVATNSSSFGFGVDDQGNGYLSSNRSAPTKIMYFEYGKVGIGAPPKNGSHYLYVAGGITTEEVRIKTQPNWSDFVFEKDFKLRSVYELDQYIQTNKHLPDMPSSSVVNKEGIELGAMNSLLLQKIEELTLYIIQQQKQIDNLNRLMQKE